MSRDDHIPPRLQAAYAAMSEPDSETGVMHLAIARGLLAGYQQRWDDEQWQVEATEQEFYVPIINPATRRRSRHFLHGGKVDGLISGNGQKLLLEHKTCSEDISPGSSYWRRLAIDSQISGYLLACWLQGRRLDGVLYDVIRKPEIKPKMLSTKATLDFKKTSRYCGWPIPAEEYRQFHRDPDRRETPEMYAARLAQDAMSRPDWYFGRSIVTRLDREVLEYAKELWQSACDAHRAHKENDRRRNDQSCFAYHRPCEYLDLCSGHDTPENPRWQIMPSLHPELEEIPDEHRSRLLTNSRLKCFAQCRRKHHYRYQLGLTRLEKAPALAFGHLFHQALAAWWECEQPLVEAADRQLPGQAAA